MSSNALSSLSANPSSTPSGLLVAYKPAGPTSFQVLQRVKRFLEADRAGHCGTLDPAAEGVLLILLGRATEKQDSLMKCDKIYSGSLLLGTETDSGDLEGKIIQQAETTPFETAVLEETARQLTGEIQQTPPMYSAVKVGGSPLYKLARKGLSIPRASRPITIHRFEITGYAHPTVHFRVECSSGTYIRVLAEEFGRKLGCGAVLSKLVREKVGIYDSAQSLTMEEIQKIGREETWARIIPL